MNIQDIRKLVNDRKFKETIKAVNGIKETDKYYAEALVIRGCAQHAIGNMTTGERDWNLALEKSENGLDLLKEQAMRHLQLRSHEVSTHLISRILKENMGDGIWWYLLAECQLFQKQKKEGLTTLEKFLVVSKYSEDALNKSCQLLLRSGNNRSAIELSEKSAQRFRLSTSFAVYKAKACIKLSLYKEGLQSLIGNEKAGSTIEGLILKSICYLRLDELAKSEECINHALKLEPDNQTANILIGQIYYKKGGHDKAISIWLDIAKRLEENPHPEVAFLIAKHYSENTDDNEKTIEMIKLEMSITRGLREESHYILIRCLLAEGKHSEAKKAFERAKKCFPTSIQIESVGNYFSLDI